MNLVTRTPTTPCHRETLPDPLPSDLGSVLTQWTLGGHLLGIHSPQWALSISSIGHISLLLSLLSPSHSVSCSSVHLSPKSPKLKSILSVDLKFGTRVLSLEANICHRIFRKSLGSFWRGDGECYLATIPHACPHQAGGPAARVATLIDQETASSPHLNASWKASGMSLWPLIAASPNLKTARGPMDFLHPLATACLQQSLRVGGKEASSACSHKKGYHCKLAATWLACKPRTTEKQQRLRHSRLSIHPSTCFSLCRLTLPVNHLLSLRSIGSSKDPQTDTNLCALICILTLTHPSSVYPVLKPCHWCIDSRYTSHPTPLSTGESSLTGSWMPETTGSTKPYYKHYVFSYTAHSTYDKV